MTMEAMEALEEWSDSYDDVYPGDLTRLVDRISKNSEDEGLRNDITDLVEDTYFKLDGWIDSKGFYKIVMEKLIEEEYLNN